MKKKKIIKVRKAKIMPRPVGSKNKHKTKVEKSPIDNGGISMPEANDLSEVETPKAVVPEVAKVEEKKELSPNAICLCGHKNEMHYGGENGWCNTEGCHCQTFK